MGTTVNPATLKWLKRENATEDWVQIGGTVDGDNFVSTVPFNSFSEFTIGSNSAIVQVVVNIEGAYSGSGMIHDLNDSKNCPLFSHLMMFHSTMKAMNELVWSFTIPMQI
ncbi:MAG: hypothetical protein H6613_18195 [Ignavibacteriales bacterium]|nr:hypothetical protein [Ignavibacteriales bacterium]